MSSDTGKRPDPVPLRRDELDDLWARALRPLLERNVAREEFDELLLRALDELARRWRSALLAGDEGESEGEPAGKISNRHEEVEPP